jgi:DNA-binding beta-propeller fold protein YncE
MGASLSSSKYNAERLGGIIHDTECLQHSFCPGGIAITDKFVFISDMYNNRINVFDKKECRLIYTFGESGNSCVRDYVKLNHEQKLDNIRFNNPTCMTINNNMLYIVDTSNCTIQIFKISNGGKLLFYDCFGKYGEDDDSFEIPYSIAVDNDKIYVGDIKNHKLKIFNKKDHKFVKIIENKYEKNFKPEFITVDNNYIFVSNINTNITYVIDKKSYEFVKKMENNKKINNSGDEILIPDTRNNCIRIYDKRSFNPIRTIRNKKNICRPLYVTVYNDEIYILCHPEHKKSYICVLERYYKE